MFRLWDCDLVSGLDKELGNEIWKLEFVIRDGGLGFILGYRVRNWGQSLGWIEIGID